MTRLPRYLYAWEALVTCVAVLSHIGHPAASAADLPPRIREALGRNADGLRSVTIAWKRAYRSGLSEEEFLSRTRNPDRGFFRVRQSVVTYHNGLLRYGAQYEQFTEGSFLNVNTDAAFDRQLLYVGDVTMPIPSVVIFDREYLANRTPDYLAYTCDYLEAAGFRVHNRYRDVHLPPGSEILELLAEGGRLGGAAAGSAVNRERYSINIETAGGSETFELDPSRQYAVVRRHTRDTMGRLLRISINSDFEEVSGPELWLPRNCRVEYFQWEEIPDQIFEEPILTAELQLSEVNRRHWPDTHFVLQHDQPGTFVLDSRSQAAGMPGATLRDDGLFSYRVDATPEHLARTVAVTRNRWRMILVVVNAAVLLLVLLLAGRRLARRRGPEP